MSNDKVQATFAGDWGPRVEAIAERLASQEGVGVSVSFRHRWKAQDLIASGVLDELTLPVVETCRPCVVGPILIASLSPEDDLPLCGKHWSQWIARFLHSEGAPCSAHLIEQAEGATDE